MKLKKWNSWILVLVMVLSLVTFSPFVAKASLELDLLQVAEWNQLFGGTENDFFYSVIQTEDGGYVAAGLTYSSASGEIEDSYNGSVDALLVKFDLNGNRIWDQVFGGRSRDEFLCVTEALDGSLLVAGNSWSSASGEITDVNNGSSDWLLVKFDAQGQPIWNRLFGGSSNDNFHAIEMAHDGGFVVAGSTLSSMSGEITEKSNGSSDGLLVKFDANGIVEWQQLHGGADSDGFSDIISLVEGGYVVAGTSSSSASGELTDQGNGSSDGLLAKFDEEGQPVWDQLFGGWEFDQFQSVFQTSDSGFIVAGYTGSSATGELKDSSNGNTDALLVRFDQDGQPLWDQLYGGTGSEHFLSVIQTSDGGYIAAGDSDSPISGDITDKCNGTFDGHVVRFNAFGEPVWDQNYGGRWVDYFKSISPTKDGKFIVAGYVSDEIGEFTDKSNGNADALLVKFTTGKAPVITLQPKPVTVKENGSATFSAQATGIPTPTIKWQISEDSGITWKDMGIVQSTITISSDYKEIDHLIRCVFTNSIGVAITEAVQWKIIPKPNVQVIAGANRFETAVAISKATYNTTDVAILVQAWNFPDALAAGPIAYALNAPILLTSTASLHTTTLQELRRLQVKKVIIMGGASAISNEVERTLVEAEGLVVERIAGLTRYSTAVEAANYLGGILGNRDTAIFASGISSADAVASGSYAAKLGIPILLTNGATLAESIIEYLNTSNIQNITIIGGTSAVGSEVEEQLTSMGINVIRISGANRVETSVAVAEAFFEESVEAIAANGWVFADALSAAPYAARMNAPILLVHQDRIDQIIGEYLSPSGINRITVVGGDAAVGSVVRTDLLDLISQ